MVKQDLKKFSTPVFPFTAIVGQEEMKLALQLNVIDPKINKIIVQESTPNSSAIAEKIKSVCTSGMVFLTMPLPGPLPKKPPSILEKMSLKKIIGKER